jgi:toxin ParE1/3/4
MAAKARFATLARADLKETGLYIARTNRARGHSFVREIVDKCQIYAENPDMGRNCSDLLGGMRSFPHGNYVIFYRRYRSGIQIVRVIHAQRDIRPEMFDQP